MAQLEHAAMSNKSRGDRGEYEFTRATYDELKDAEHRFEVEFTMELLPSAQRGVWVLACIARAKGEHQVLSIISSYRAVWPNSVAVSFAAFSYQCMHRLCRMVEAWHAQREADEHAQYARG